MPLKKNGGAVEEAFLRVYWQTFRLSTDMSIDIADEVNYVPFYELGLMIISMSNSKTIRFFKK